MKPVHIATVLLLIFLLTVPAVAETTVKPAYDLPVKGEKHDPTPISYWQLPFWIILLVFVQAPIEIFTTFKGLPYLGYISIANNNVLSNGTRLRIYDHIKKNPGVNFSVISKETGVNRGTLSYHLKILGLNNKIKVYKNRGYTKYFENHMKFNDDDRRILQYLTKNTSRKIIENLIEYPGVSRKDLSNAIGISGPAVTQHMKYLQADGVIEMKKEGQFNKYYVSAIAVQIMQNVLQKGP